MSLLSNTRKLDQTNYVSNTPIYVSDTVTMLVSATGSAVTIQYTMDAAGTIDANPGSVTWHDLDMATLTQATVNGGTNPVGLGTKTIFVWEFGPIAFRLTTTGNFTAWIKG